MGCTKRGVLERLCHKSGVIGEFAMQKWIESIRSNPDFSTGKGTPESQIQQAETALSVKFAPDYRQCLQEFGAISYRAHELTGFSMDETLDVVAVTKRFRQKHNVSEKLYVIEEAHIDGIVVWQDTNGAVYETDPYSNPRKIAGSLYEYLFKNTEGL